jgi:hypothetical protein
MKTFAPTVKLPVAAPSEPRAILLPTVKSPETRALFATESPIPVDVIDKTAVQYLKSLLFYHNFLSQFY